MEAIDVDGDGDITQVSFHIYIRFSRISIKDEFIEHACKSEFMANMLNAE
jgi:hypothetical protein